MRYQDIDWNRMWQEAREKKSWQKKKHKDWDKRASSFAARNIDSPYADQFLDLAKIDPSWTVLDMGSGPGTLAVPLARRVKKVTAVDFSGAMLDELRKRAAREGLTNIEIIQGAWEDDWETLGIKRHDVTISSRSLSVPNLQDALAKLDRWAAKAVYITDRVGAGPFDPDIFQAVGRPFEPGPDYIFTLNILYNMGIHAHVDFITLEHNRLYASPEEAYESYAWMLDSMTESEEQKLRSYVDSRLARLDDTTWRLSRRVPPRWALLWWRKTETGPKRGPATQAR